MMAEHNPSKRLLPLSHMIYRDDEIDESKAKQLIVYHYPLSKNYSWKEWESHLDNNLDSRQFTYLMKSYHGQFGLFVTLQNETDQPPKITNADGIELRPERVSYAPELNPVWIRLIMRMLSAFGNHCQGRYSLGRPLLKTDEWSSGINAISLDCRTQQLNDGNTTEVVLFHENIPLRPIKENESLGSFKSPIWTYGKNKVLVRWYGHNKRKPSGSLYKPIKKNKNHRKQRPFLDVSSPKQFLQSCPVILKPIQDDFIHQASHFGFYLYPKVLKLSPLNIKTKYKQSLCKNTAFQSLTIKGEINVIDLRVGKKIPLDELLSTYRQLLSTKNIDIKFKPLSTITTENIQTYDINRAERLLVLLDQKPGIDQDHYHFSANLRTKGAVQHINTNPFDILIDPIEKGYLKEVEQDESITLYPVDDRYYSYCTKDIEKKIYQETIARNLEIALKELELKRLLLWEKAKISDVLPHQKNCLNKNTIVITEGFLFTVHADRPVLIPFNPSDESSRKQCNRWLASFNTSVADLFTTLKDEWPYSYRPQDVMDGFGSKSDKQKRFASRLTLILHIDSNDRVSIILQDPKYDKPHLLPQGLTDVYAKLNNQAQKQPLNFWVLPAIHDLHSLIDELEEEDELSPVKASRLKNELEELKILWNEKLLEMYKSNVGESAYKGLKKAMFDQWLKARGKKNDASLIGSWDSLMSRHFDKPLNDIKGWLRAVPGIQRLWFDHEQNYMVVGGLSPVKSQLSRQPSIRQWHALKGKLEVELLTELVDVDWVRMNQLAGNPCVTTLVNRWKECHSGDAPMLVPVLMEESDS